MMQHPGIRAQVILDSVSPDGYRLTTVQYRAPRCILAEINTHRDFSRNARSSRAVPVARLVDEIRREPFVPLWTRNQPGMQGQMLDPDSREAQRLFAAWSIAKHAAVAAAEELAMLGAHKQVVNRVLEPFAWVDGLISSTRWENFFVLRCHEDAEPHMQALAYAIRDTLAASTPRETPPGAWHLPYILDSERADSCWDLDSLKLISAARCARVSYKPFDADDVDPDRDLARGRAMLEARPLHASPFEHVATPDERYGTAWVSLHDHGNFTGWRQLRRMIPLNTVRG